MNIDCYIFSKLCMYGWNTDNKFVISKCIYRHDMCINCTAKNCKNQKIKSKTFREHCGFIVSRICTK